MRTNTWRILCGCAVSLLTAVMLILSFHPHNVWFLAFFALVPMLTAQHLILPVKWSGLASAVGIGGWLIVFLGSMFGFSPAGRIIQIIILVIMVIQVFAFPGIRKFHIRTGYRWFILHGLADWVGFEMVRSFIPPLNTHGFIAQTMYTQPWILLPMSVFSIYGLGLVIIGVNFTLARAVLGWADGKWGLEKTWLFSRQLTIRSTAVMLLALLIWIGTSRIIQYREPSEPPVLSVAAVQHNFPVGGHQDTDSMQLVRFNELARQVRSAAGQGARLIVLPELGLGFDPQVRFTEEFRDLAAETGAYLFIGYGIVEPSGWRNEMVFLTPEGEFGETYGKNHPTAPGEPPIITAGRYPVYEMPEGQVATLICNDIHFTDVARTLAGKGAGLIASPTLELPGIALEQVAQAVMRAVENRVAVVKADVAYAAAIIDPYGKIVDLRNAAPGGGAFALVANVPLGTASTFYTGTGDLLGWVCLAGYAFFLAFQIIVGRRKPA